MAEEPDSGKIDSHDDVKTEGSQNEDDRASEDVPQESQQSRDTPSLILGSRLEEPSSDSAMARLLLASSMAQRDMAIIDRETPSSALNLSVPDHGGKHRHSPHQNSLVSRDVRSFGSSNHSQSPPVSDVQQNSDGLGVGPGNSQIDSMQPDMMDYGKDATYLLPDSSPESSPMDPVMTNVYKCRLCSFCTSTYTQLQLHMPKHGGVKALKCHLCDYTTNDKSNFRRHRRLHVGNNPVNVLKCGKCSFSTILPRKFREHFVQVHNEHLGPNLPYSLPTHSTYPPANYPDTQYGINQPDLGGQNLRHTTGSGNFSASNALHSLLTGIHHQVPTVNFQHQTYTAQTQGLQTQFGSYVAPMRQQANEENHLASNYLRSIVSSIMNTHPTQRVPPSSTITSSGYYLSPSGRDHPHVSVAQPTLVSDGRGHPVKIKVEPPEREDTPDVSSSVIPNRQQGFPDSLGSLSSYHLQHQKNFMGLDSNEASTSIRANSAESTSSSQAEGRSNSVNTTVKIEIQNRGIQCNLPHIKTEACFDTFVSVTDQGVQCELGHLPQHQRSSTNDTGSSLQSANRCHHCGISFEDEVLYYIHVGCHSHTDPFVCNVCGKQCGNKYGFYSHIMRGHQC
ncbi:protein hunchback-like [Saccostrea cucullata]|uniref:protein hunchback-like n=1 Tax=Saccostrea cuccullata TaxID=36930 RepID=UPI002ED21BE8